jgi:tripartite-type tricarboxylate transporter receptor subunit TctC
LASIQSRDKAESCRDDFGATITENRMKGVALAAAVLVSAVSTPAAHAEWPDHAIRWVVPFGPGGANDLIARVAAEAASNKLGQPVLIENRPGATVGTQGLPVLPPMATPF